MQFTALSAESTISQEAYIRTLSWTLRWCLHCSIGNLELKHFQKRKNKSPISRRMPVCYCRVHLLLDSLVEIWFSAGTRHGRFSWDISCFYIFHVSICFCRVLSLSFTRTIKPKYSPIWQRQTGRQIALNLKISQNWNRSSDFGWLSRSCLFECQQVNSMTW